MQELMERWAPRVFWAAMIIMAIMFISAWGPAWAAIQGFLDMVA